MEEEEEGAGVAASLSSGGSSEGEPCRPPYSFAALIAMALEGSPEGRLPLRAICQAIAGRFPFFRLNQKGWQNSVRHNLSLNACFVRWPPGHGKGGLWGLDPAYRGAFQGGGSRRRRRQKPPRPPAPAPQAPPDALAGPPCFHPALPPPPYFFPAPPPMPGPPQPYYQPFPRLLFPAGGGQPFLDPWPDPQTPFRPPWDWQQEARCHASLCCLTSQGSSPV